MASSDHIRNFVIVAHVNHGKSTLADRFLEYTATIEARRMRAQFLDQMDLERERGITIKMQPVRMVWRPEIRNQKSGTRSESQIRSTQNDFEFRASNFEFPDSEYILNLIDTPGHSDFSYEVSRSLAAVEGAILLVDATQGIQAQTLATFHLARAHGLVIIPAVNKVDLASARVAETAAELAVLAAAEPSAVISVSGKTGAGVPALLAAIIARVPPPQGTRDAAFRALIFDSHFDTFRGVIAHVRVVDGTIASGTRIRMLATGAEAVATEVGSFHPELVPAARLEAGDIGYLATGLKEPGGVKVGDTIAAVAAGSGVAAAALPGYREPMAVVFAGIYPENADQYNDLRDALEKIKLNDAAVSFELESSDALGRGFRAGFLGMLHLEIVGERIRREYGIQILFVAPSVAYRVRLRSGETRSVYSATHLPDPAHVAVIEEPWVRLEVVIPSRFLGSVTKLLGNARGRWRSQTHLGERVVVEYELPLRDIIVEFSDRVKSVTEGYGSYSYEFLEYRTGELVRLDVLVAGEPVEALAQIVPKDRAYEIGRDTASALKELLPRQLFAVAVQAAAAGRIIARETVPALRKDVSGYLYGGDRTRKMKLWKKQQRGKQRLTAHGRVEIPPDVFRALLKR